MIGSKDEDLEADPLEIKSHNGKESLTFKNQKWRVVEFIKCLSVAHECVAERTIVDGEEILFY